MRTPQVFTCRPQPTCGDPTACLSPAAWGSGCGAHRLRSSNLQFYSPEHIRGSRGHRGHRVLVPCAFPSSVPLHELFPLLQCHSLLFSRSQSCLGSTVPPHLRMLRSSSPKRGPAHRTSPSTCSGPPRPHWERVTSLGLEHMPAGLLPPPHWAESAECSGPPSTRRPAHSRQSGLLQEPCSAFILNKEDCSISLLGS